MLSTTTPAFAVTTPATPRVDAISTAPSMSTTSKFVVPSTSISPEISNAVPIKVCVSVSCPLLAIVIASASEATPIVPPSLITKSSAIVSNPTELKLIFSVAASEAPHLNESLVALLSAAKSPSEMAAIPAHTVIASVPVPSSGA